MASCMDAIGKGKQIVPILATVHTELVSAMNESCTYKRSKVKLGQAFRWLSEQVGDVIHQVSMSQLVVSHVKVTVLILKPLKS